METLEVIWKVPTGEHIVSIVQWRDAVFIATNWTVYRVTEDGRDVVPIRTHAVPSGRTAP